MKGIPFNTGMMQALIDGGKTQTRRAIKPQPDEDGLAKLKGIDEWHDTSARVYHCPYGKVGDRLFVQEEWKIGAWNHDASNSGKFAIDYRVGADTSWHHVGWSDYEAFVLESEQDCVGAGLVPENDMFKWEKFQSPCRWRDAQSMPQWASRLTIKITNIRVERLQEISDEDAEAEGAFPLWDTYAENIPVEVCNGSINGFAQRIWQSIYKGTPYSWEKNPWVWVIEFEKGTG